MRDRDRLREKMGHCQIGPPTKQQQQACVSASATAGALLPYICRRDEAVASREYTPVAEMNPDQLKKHVAASSRSLPIAHTQRARPLPPPAGTESRIHS